ncbi:MAG: hypothetical protein Q9174_001090 [Haloplaca sp. 1 TL-2023]
MPDVVDDSSMQTMTVYEYMKQRTGSRLLNFFSHPHFAHHGSTQDFFTNPDPLLISHHCFDRSPRIPSPLLWYSRATTSSLPVFPSDSDKNMSQQASPWTESVTGSRAAYSSGETQATPSSPTVAQQMNAAQSEAPGARYHGVVVQSQGVRLLIPRKTAVFHVMDHAFTRGAPNGNMQPWEFPTGLTVTDLLEALGVDTGVREYQCTSNGSFFTRQIILVGDTKSDERLDEMGWCAGRGFITPRIWIEILG